MKEMDAIASIFMVMVPFAIIGLATTVVSLVMLAKYLLA